MIRLKSAGIVGLEVKPVEVELDLTPGLHAFSIVGLPDKAVEEAKERVNAALKNSGAKPPRQQTYRIIVNLAPADLKKHGPAYDLPIALAFLAASNQIAKFNFGQFLFLGELALDGSLRAISGILPIARFAKEQNLILVIPEPNLKEALLVDGLKIIAPQNLTKLIDHLEGKSPLSQEVGKGLDQVDLSCPDFDFDMAYIRGQEQVKRALEIVAAGGHNLLMTGAPGSGKTLLARALPSILPKMTQEEALEVTSIWSISGLLSYNRPLITQRPFRNPHHSSSLVALIGGGTFPKPGEVSLAHRGVLFLDEIPEFTRGVIEALRQPLEDGFVTVARARGTIRYPARFMLIAAKNPCPCGNQGDPKHECRCTPAQILNYKKKISGPILDRIDLLVSVPRVEPEKIIQSKLAENSQDIRSRIEQARQIQKERLAASGVLTNAEMNPAKIEEFCRLDAKTKDFLAKALDKYGLTARSYHRILKVSRTIADLSNAESIKFEHVAEALQYREGIN